MTVLPTRARLPVALAAAALLLAGCASVTSATSSPTAPASGQASQASPTASPACSGADYCPPASWETAKASTPLTQIPPFAEPLNVIISAKSTVPLATLQKALGTWDTVSTATQVNVAGIHIACISAEHANVAGQGFQSQQAAWRLGGCLKGNGLSLSGDEDHVRIWHQPVGGSKYGAWFIAASFETMCLVREGKLQTATASKAYAVLHSGRAYHCVDGGPGSITSKHPSGYDDAAAAFSAAVATAAKSRGWQLTQRTVTVPRQAHSGEGSVPFSSTVRVLTLTT
jgi:hypothetical protein